MRDEDRIQEIEDFLKDKLSPSEKAAFMTKMQLEPDLKEEVQLYEKVFTGIESGGRKLLKEELREIEKNLSDKEVNNQPEGKRRKFPVAWVISLAASFLILLGLILVLRKEKAETPLFAAYYESYPNVIASIDRGEQITDEKKEAMRAYENQEYERAFKLLNGLTQKYPTEAYLRFYSGISLIELDKSHEAIIALQPLAENDNDFSDQATWYLALAHLKLNESNRSKEYLEQLADRDGPYKEKAIELLKGMNNEQ